MIRIFVHVEILNLFSVPVNERSTSRLYNSVKKETHNIWHLVEACHLYYKLNGQSFLQREN